MASRKCTRRAAREPYQAADDQGARATVLAEIRQKLIDRRPDRSQFVAAFRSRFYLTNEVTRDSKLIRYVLERFLQESSPATSTVHLTFEHIMPQSELKRGVSLETVGSIGNLLLVSDPVNSKLDSKSSKDEKSVLSTIGSSYDIGGVLNCDSWTAKAIAERTEMLAERAYDKVWSLPVLPHSTA